MKRKAEYINYIFKKEEHTLAMAQVQIETLSVELSVCKVKDYSEVNIENDFCFTGKTDEEYSLVCQTINVPSNVSNRDDGWKSMRIKGMLEFSLIGILSGISTELAKNGISIFAISTFNTDYILVKEPDFEKALNVLKQKGYTVIIGMQ